MNNTSISTRDLAGAGLTYVAVVVATVVVDVAVAMATVLKVVIVAVTVMGAKAYFCQDRSAGVQREDKTGMIF